MKWLKRLFNFIYYTILYGGIIALTICAVGFFHDISLKYDVLTNQEEQMEEIYTQQVYVLQLLKQYQFFNTGLIKKVSEEHTVLESKPSYQDLKNVTVFLFRPNKKTDDPIGWIGTGTLVAKKHGYSYILTNKHICSKKEVCQIETYDATGNRVHTTLDFVKQIEAKHDLSLWRTRKNLLNKKVIKGISIAKFQDKIYSVGHYLGVPYLYTEGTFSGYQDDSVLFNIPCGPGCSGSGVFDKDANLVGVIYGGNRINDTQIDITKILAINGDVIQLFLKEYIND